LLRRGLIAESAADAAATAGAATAAATAAHPQTLELCFASNDKFSLLYRIFPNEWMKIDDLFMIKTMRPGCLTFSLVLSYSDFVFPLNRFRCLFIIFLFVLFCLVFLDLRSIKSAI